MWREHEIEQSPTSPNIELALPFSAPPVLIFVDDEAEILSEYSEFLAAFDITALTEQSPNRAARTVADSPTIRLVVTDLRMAERDGLSLIEQIRASLPAGRDMAFILLTGDAELCDLDPDLSVILLRKPVEPLALLAAVQGALANGP